MAFHWHDDTLQVPDDVLVKMSTVSLDTESFVGPHTHLTLEISMVISGVGEYRVGDRVYPVKAGDIVLFNNVELHGMWNTGKEPLVNVALEFEPRFVWSDLTHSFDKAFLAMFFERSPEFCHELDRENPAYLTIRQQFEEIRQEFNEKLPCYEMIIKGKILVLLANLLRYYNMAHIETKVIPGRYQKGMERVLSHIAIYYADDLSPEKLADIVHISPTHFYRLFRQANGMSPQEYIVKVRIMEATYMLKASDRSIAEIAQACGFRSLSNFHTAFKRIVGKTPAQYRVCPLG